MEMLRVIPDTEERVSSEMAVASHALLSGILDGSLQQGDLGFDALSSLAHSPESSQLTETANDCGSSSVAVSSQKLLSGIPNDTLEASDLKIDPLSSLQDSPKASKLTKDADEPRCVLTPKEEPCGDVVHPEEPKPTQMSHPEVIELPDECDGENGSTALPVRDYQSAEAVRGERDDDVVVLSESEGADRLRKEFCCADVPGIPRRDEEDREEVGDIVILEPTINREVPASICRESSSPRYQEYISKPDDPSEGTDSHSGQVTRCSVSKLSQQSATCKRRQSDGASHGDVAAQNWRKLAAPKLRHQLTCSSCLKLFSSRYELIRHVFVHVDDVEPPPHVCVMCGEVFTTDEEVSEHQRSAAAQCYAFVPVVKMPVRSAQEVWFCSGCEQTFQTEHRLAIHKAERHLRTVVSACTELPPSAAKLDDLPVVRAENCHGGKCKIKGGGDPGFAQHESLHRNYKRKPGRSSTHLQETPHSNHKINPGQPPRICLRTTTGITVENCVHRGSGDKKCEIISEEPHGRSPSKLNGEPPNGNPNRRKTEMSSELHANRLQEVTQGDYLNRTPEMASRESVHRIYEVTVKEPLSRLPGTAHEESVDETSAASGENLARIPVAPLDSLSSVTPAPGSLQNKPGMTPDHLIDGKPKKRRGRPPGSKNKGPSKPRARKSKTLSGELLNGTPEVTVRKPLHGLQVMKPGECMDRLLEMTPGVPLEVPDEMRSRATLDRQYEMRSGEYFYDLIPGELPDRLHEMTLGEHFYGLHEIGPREQLYSLHEMTPEMSLDSNPDVTPQESLDKLHDTTQGEPMYRLHEMTTVESVHRLHEMSPVEILYRNHESTPVSPLDRIPKLTTAEPLSSLHEMTPMDIHYRSSGSKYQGTTPGSATSTPDGPFNRLSEMAPGEPLCGLSEIPPAQVLHRPSEMAPREPLHKLTEMAPVEPLRRLSETVHRQSKMAPAETLQKPSEMTPRQPFRRTSEMAPGEPLRRLSEMPPEDTLNMLSEMEPRDPLHTLFEMATGDPFHTLFEMEPEDPFSSPSKMLPGESYNGLSEIAPEEPLSSKSQIAPGNLVNGVPKKRRGRPPGSKNKVPGKPRSRKSKTEPGEPLCKNPETVSVEHRDKLITLQMGGLNGICETVLGEPGEKKPNKNPGESEKWPCHFCHQLFCSVSGLKRHLVRHTGERNYVCDLCGKSFGRSDNLRVHKYTHMGGLPYKCDVCGRAFSWACHLRDHKRKCQSS